MKKKVLSSVFALALAAVVSPIVSNAYSQNNFFNENDYNRYNTYNQNRQANIEKWNQDQAKAREVFESQEKAFNQRADIVKLREGMAKYEAKRQAILESQRTNERHYRNYRVNYRPVRVVNYNHKKVEKKVQNHDLSFYRTLFFKSGR